MDIEDLASDASQVAFEELGMCGAMISGSKSSYYERHPNGNPIFNANVVTEPHGKIWFGDLELMDERSTSAIQQLANRLNVRVYILREHDARFANESKPLIQNAVAVYKPARP